MKRLLTVLVATFAFAAPAYAQTTPAAALATYQNCIQQAGSSANAGLTCQSNFTNALALIEKSNGTTYANCNVAANSATNVEAAKQQCTDQLNAATQAVNDARSSGAAALNASPAGQAIAQQSANATAAADAARLKAQQDQNTQRINSAPTSPVSPLDEALGKVMVVIMIPFSWLVGASAMMLDYSVYYTVFGMGQYVKDLPAIGITWHVLRDLGNIMLIFGFLAIGISIILSTERFGYGQKMLPGLLMAAVLLNFSLFFSEAIIDVGNIFASEVYTQINGGQPPSADSQAFLSSVINGGNQGISNKIMSQLGLQTLYGAAQNDPKVFNGAHPLVIGFMGIILFTVTAFVFFSLAFILIFRFALLILLLAVSPIGFAAFAIPKLKARADQWWDTLLHQTVTAPILFLLLYVALQVITDSSFLTGFGVTAQDASLPGTAALGFIGGVNLPGFGSYILSFVVAVSLLLLVVIQAKRLSAVGAGWASQTAGKLSLGITAWAGRSTLGRAGYLAGRQLRQSELFNRVDAMTGRAGTRTLDRVATATFDPRASAGFKELDAAAGGHIGGGKVAEGGFVGARARNIKGHEAAAKDIKTAVEEAQSREKAAVATATQAHEEAQSAAKKVMDTHEGTERDLKAATSTLNTQTAEVERLTKLDSANRQSNTQFSTEGREVSQKLKEAQEAQRTARVAKEAAEAAHTKAEEELKKAASAAEKTQTAKEEAEQAEKDKLKGAQEAYAGGIDRWWKLGGSEAAKKIRKSFKEKSDDDKLKDLIKKIGKAQVESENKDKEESKPD